ncbi:hypothetical protein BC830DRAFT_1165575 [Chytriomyces sp. MP71]|nr:hypothetical protein BC830DRAFT_1165575 [Chytriomyces sp. MP71]
MRRYKFVSALPVKEFPSVAGWLKEGSIKPITTVKLPLTDIRTAHELSVAGRTVGQIVLNPSHLKTPFIGKIKNGDGKMLAKVIEGAHQASQQAHKHLEGIKAKVEHVKTSIVDYELQPFDVVLFAGNDPTATFIKRVELHEVVPRIDTPFHELWTHSGILVNSDVLPLPCLEQGKLYILESVFSGEVAGYVYSKVLPVDHLVPPKGFHLGPQLRDLYAVVEEGSCNVGICTLTEEYRAVIRNKLAECPTFLLDLYATYKDFSYPITNILPVVASASQSLYMDLKKYKDATAAIFPNWKEAPKNSVFCSELVAIILRSFGLPTFTMNNPDTFTPLQLEIVLEMERKVNYAKFNQVSNLKPGNKLKTGDFLSETQKLIKSLAVHDKWVTVPPAGGVPANAEPAGEDIDGTPLYIARVKIGTAYYLGKIAQGWPSPVVTYFDREVTIHFGHEVLVSLDGMTWVSDRNGNVPRLRSVKAGMDEEGNYVYVARGIVGDRFGFGFSTKGSLAPGIVAPHMKAAHIPFAGKDVKLQKYEVLSYKVF